MNEMREAFEVWVEDNLQWPFVIEPRLAFEAGYQAAIAAVKEGGPVAWLTYMKNDDVGFWPTYEEACSYCEDEVFPTPLYAAPKETT